MSLVRRVLLEVAVETPDDAFAADQGGADRLELCAALDLGGLTPSLGSLVQVRKFAQKPICVMIRPRGGDFVYSPAEIDIMIYDVARFRELQPAGFVFGVLEKDGTINLEACLKLLKEAGGIPCTFHRAFDRTPKLTDSLNELIGMGFKRILTSGQADTAEQGLKKLAELVELAEGKLSIIACGKVRAENVARLVKFTKVQEVHGSFAEPVPPQLGVGHRGYAVRSQTSRQGVQAAREILNRPWDLLMT
jgi:copper homeostasis protein